ncbi:MAG TPA: Nascent polypeptide-associated complex protein, partial [Acidobacteriota bacterium]|nr:Nascent polypeptide-associated complex protein [Acidobacteriota bacterium]
SPQVSKVNMMGQETYQVVGAARVEEIESEITINEDDVATVVAQTGVSEDEATEAIRNSKGDLAAAILSLKRDGTS